MKLEINMKTQVSELGIADRQLIAIARAMTRDPKVLILDEPTAVLVPHEVEELFRNIRELQESGTTIIFIDHKLDEVLEGELDTVIEPLLREHQTNELKRISDESES